MIMRNPLSAGRRAIGRRSARRYIATVQDHVSQVYEDLAAATTAVDRVAVLIWLAGATDSICNTHEEYGASIASPEHLTPDTEVRDLYWLLVATEMAEPWITHERFCRWAADNEIRSRIDQLAAATHIEVRADCLRELARTIRPHLAIAGRIALFRLVEAYYTATGRSVDEVRRLTESVVTGDQR